LLEDSRERDGQAYRILCAAIRHLLGVPKS
jgi:hypothetical protein